VTRPNGPSDNSDPGLVEHTEQAGISEGVPISPPLPEPFPELATRAKQRARHEIQQNRFVVIAAGAIVTALLIFVSVSMPHRSGPPKIENHIATIKDESARDMSGESDQKSLFPITDSGSAASKETHHGFLNEQDLERTVIRSGANAPQTVPVSGTLGSVPPFGDKWQAPPYESGSTATEISELSKAEHEVMEQPSLVYVRKVSTGPTGTESAIDGVAELSLGLATGTRLRARLESAASTAVQSPVLAVVEYNYEQGGELIVPAGAKAVGHIRGANRSGYIDLRFDSLLMPDGASVPIEAAATGLDLRPLKGKVEGKNTGKNILLRSLSGIGQAGSLFLGQGSLNQPLSESDLMRERLASNIGETGDEEVSQLAVNQQIVVTVSAGVPIYVELQQSAKTNQTPAASGARTSPSVSAANMDQLRQLLQLQQELNQSTASNQPAR
jgi:hypothetical protein